MEHEKVLSLFGGAKKFGEKAELKKPRQLMSLLGNPQDDLRFVHIAGTNGKGSVAAYIAEVLHCAGISVGLYTSPFIYEFNERIRVNGVSIDDDSLVRMMKKVRAAAEQMRSEGTGYPTEFDMVTATAFCYFAEKKCDIVVLEVGLGGRFDATNIIKTPEVSVITKLGLDHTQYLGETIEEIAFEKCGIIKEGGITVCLGEQEDAALSVIRCRAEEENNRLIECKPSEATDCLCSVDGNRFVWRGKSYQTALCGEYQISNACLALTVLDVLKKRGFSIDDAAIIGGLRKTRWSGRMEILKREPLLIADGSHNPDGMKAFVDSARKLVGEKKVVCVVSMMKDKEVFATISALRGFANEVVFTKAANPRAVEPEMLAEQFDGQFAKVYCVDDIAKAVSYAQNLAGIDGAVVAVGSLYMIADVAKSI